MAYAERARVVLDDEPEAPLGRLGPPRRRGLVVEVDDAAANDDAAGTGLQGRDVGLGVLDVWMPGRVDGRVQRRVHLLGGEAVPDGGFGRRRGVPRSGGEEELD